MLSYILQYKGAMFLVINKDNFITQRSKQHFSEYIPLTY